jgi:chemotaxis protein CheD
MVLELSTAWPVSDAGSGESGAPSVKRVWTPPRKEGYASHYLPPGQIVASAAPSVITTIVGSCVAVCLTDPEAGVGGINHYLLPERIGTESSLRYGVVAIPRLIERVLALGAAKDRLEAKVFGGASVVGALTRRGDHLGAKNARLAFELLRAQAIRVVAHDVGGDRGRKVVFHSDDGTAWVRRL